LKRQGLGVLRLERCAGRGRNGAATVSRLQDAIPAAMVGPDVIRQMRAQGVIPVQNSSGEFEKFIESGQKKWGRSGKSLHLKLT
jgi:tripartite-type tricarboxylate transporter receptor subunit TctC